MKRKTRIAVIFGGPSQEHDVSVVSASQLMDAADNRYCEVLPVYLDFENRFYTSPGLREVETYRPKPPGLKPVKFGWGPAGPYYQINGEPEQNRLDCVLPVLHGPFGEDGRIQGYFETIGIPVTGFSAINSAIAMRKDATKALVKSEGVNVLPHVSVNRGRQVTSGEYIQRVETEIGYPAIIKPCHLGSSIGVGVANNRPELETAIEHVLTLDTVALVEPRVDNLVEYNVSLIHQNNEIKLSAIESPKSVTDLLDFREKYLSSEDGSGGAKGDFLPSQGMLSLTRDINPTLPDELQEKIYRYARDSFQILGARGAPRIDFLSNSKTGELWFNEINPIPGSYGFFLWEAAEQPLLFPELISHLASEAMQTSLKFFDDPVPAEARLLPR